MSAARTPLPAFQDYQFRFTRHIRNPAEHARPQGVPARRMRVYTEIVFNNMEGTLASCYPVCKKVLGARRWQRLVRDFFARHRCSTPLFRQIPEEFLHWLETAQPQGVPPFLSQLAHYEWVELALAVSDAVLEEGCDADGDLLAGIPALAPALLLLRYDWPVQRISPRFKPQQPLADPVWLLVFRDHGDEVQFIEPNPVSARLLELLQVRTFTGRAALEQIAGELRHPDAEQVVAFGAAILADLRHRGAILGTLIVNPCK